MKNIFLKAIPFGIAFLFGLNSQAQVTSEVRDYWDSTNVTNDTMYFWVGQGESHAWNFNQTNMGSSQVSYRFKKIYLQMQTGASALFCVYHNDDINDPQSQCYGPTVYFSANFITDPGEHNTLMADFNSGTTTPGISIVQYHIWDVSNPSDSVNITLVYNVTPVGMAESFGDDALGEPYPNPVNAQFSLPVNSSLTNSWICITNISGQQVGENIMINSSLITIDAATWSEGIYFVVLYSEDGEVIGRRKLVKN